FFRWVLTQCVLRCIHSASFDWGWLFQHSKASSTVIALLTLAALWFSYRTARNSDLKHRFGRGLAILRDRRRYVREVASWQLASWVCRIASLYWFLKAFHVRATLHNALLAQVVDSLATLLPFSPGGAGAPSESPLVCAVFGNVTRAGSGPPADDVLGRWPLRIGE